MFGFEGDASDSEEESNGEAARESDVVGDGKGRETGFGRLVFKPHFNLRCGERKA
jgi:hypothetical protein